jgi:hypothetical protein
MVTKIIAGDKILEVINNSNFSVKEGDNLWLEINDHRKSVRVESISKVVRQIGEDASEAWEEIKVIEK